MDRKDVEMMVWDKLLSVIMFFAFSVALVYLSIVSYFQTESAFRTANDPSIVVLGFALGSYISHGFAVLLQYGQNIALFVRKYFLSNESVFSFWGREVSQKELALWGFYFCAGIDAFTNIIWFYNSVETPKNAVIAFMLRLVGYSGMVLVVLVEEVLGWALNSLSKAFDQLKSAVEYNNKKRRIAQNQSNTTSNQREERRQIPRNFDEKPRQNFFVPTQENREEHKPNRPTLDQERLKQEYLERLRKNSEKPN